MKKYTIKYINISKKEELSRCSIKVEQSIIGDKVRLMKWKTENSYSYLLPLIYLTIGRAKTSSNTIL